ncbi:MAG: hypothetical protein CMH84_06350 [Nocardioides sp.]|nr:hypothetical protein [Nocardioides sp.]
MFTSGTKKGLAGSAVTALAVAGLPLLAGPAGAVTHTSTLGADEVDLVSPVATTVSAKPDGQNATQRLTAIGGSNVTGVRFEYRIGSGPWTLIANQTSRNDDGAFAVEWNPTPIAGSADVTLRATGLGTAAQSPDTDDLTGVTVDNNADTVNVTDGSALDVFQAPYSNDADAGQFAVVEGTSSATGATPTLDFYDPSADAWAGQGDSTESTTPQGSATGTWRGVLDITDYDYGSGTDQVLVKAAGATDDAESFVVNRQQLGTVTAEPTNANVPGSGSAEITITVVDGAGTPIAGAEVRREGGAYVGQTDADGQGTTDQDGGTQAYYYANATDSDAFESGLGDKRSEDVTVGQYSPEPSSLEATSANGEVFDYDEYDADDISIQVKDQEGEDVPFASGTGQTVEYTWTFEAFDGDPAAQETEGTAVVGVDGSADIPLPANPTEGGTYTLEAGLRANPVTGGGAVDSEQVLQVKAGQAEITFDDDEVAGAAGDSAPVSGTLALEDGTGLPGRPVTLTYAADGSGDAEFDQESGDDAPARTVETGADGSFSATLDDPAAAQGQAQATETGEVTAETDPYEDPNSSADTDDADASATTDVTFFNDAAPEGAEVAITGLQGTGKPGAPAYGTVTVTDDQDQPVPNVAVRLTVDGDSFFTNGPADGRVGQPAGDLQERGQAITLVTDGQGEVSFGVGIERSEDFDDDGMATDTVTATVGETSDEADVAWSSADPLNGGDVQIDLAADRFQESGVLPKAPTTDDVAYDVKVTDQFGNLVGDEDVAITADGGEVVDEDGDAVDTVTSDFDADPEFELSSDSEGDVTPTGTWDANTSVYAADGGDADDDADIVTTDGTDEVTGDGPTAEFYEVDFANSTFELTQVGDEEREVGDTVIMTYTATDQEGEEIEFDVAFFRTGPGNDDDGSADDRVATGEDGIASYVFSGNTEGRARVSAIGYVGDQVVADSKANDTVDFGEVDGPGGDPIEILLAADSNGPKKDIVRVQADEAAAGETIRLFVIRGTKAKGNKRLIEIREDVVPEDGRLTFKKADRNGNRKTRFIAKIRANGNVSKSNTQKPR